MPGWTNPGHSASELAERGSTQQEQDDITCPDCGREFGNLPKHMVACDGGDDALRVGDR
jgi:hypothetical protein